jgi:hypothetical protein
MPSFPGSQETSLIGRVGGALCRIGGQKRSLHSESGAKLLIEKGANFAIFSEMTLIFLQNYSDFDSAIPRFESWRPSH